MQFSSSRFSRLNPIKLFAIGFLLVLAAVESVAQSTEVRVSLKTSETVSIELKGAAARTWTFPNSYGNLVDLSNRIENVSGSDRIGRSVQIVRAAPGEWRADQDVTQINYLVRLAPPSRSSDLSHVSWVTRDYGVLMLRDLLPQQNHGDTDLTINLPSGWSSASSLKPVSLARYRVEAPDKTVIAIGKSLRELSARTSSSHIKLITTGTWAFKDADQLKMLRQLLDEHVRIFQRPLSLEPALLLLPLPGVASSERWSAETRGATVLLLMGAQAKRKPALARLKVVLAHELFHLWVPNSLTLQGNYDWFFEGFTLYQALLTALRLHYIKFDDYLETLGRVWDSYRSSSERDKLSLLEASERRWTTASSLVYDKGMLVAFIYDLMLRQNSGNRSTMSDLYSGLLRTAIGSQREANELLLETLDRQPGMQQFSEQFVSNTSDIELAKIVKSFGLELTTNSMRSRIEVSNNLTPQQREVLKGIGYK